jgi:hypothetical protein
VDDSVQGLCMNASLCQSSVSVPHLLLRFPALRDLRILHAHSSLNEMGIVSLGLTERICAARLRSLHIDTLPESWSHRAISVSEHVGCLTALTRLQITVPLLDMPPLPAQLRQLEVQRLRASNLHTLPSSLTALTLGHYHGQPATPHELGRLRRLSLSWCSVVWNVRLKAATGLTSLSVVSVGATRIHHSCLNHGLPAFTRLAHLQLDDFGLGRLGVAGRVWRNALQGVGDLPCLTSLSLASLPTGIQPWSAVRSSSASLLRMCLTTLGHAVTLLPSVRRPTPAPNLTCLCVLSHHMPPLSRFGTQGCPLKDAECRARTSWPGLKVCQLTTDLM